MLAVLLLAILGTEPPTDSASSCRSARDDAIDGCNTIAAHASRLQSAEYHV